MKFKGRSRGYWSLIVLAITVLAIFAGNKAFASQEAEVSTALNPTAELGVISYTLINADSNQAIPEFDPIQDGAVINLYQFPTRNLSLRANTNPSIVGSVRFVLNSSASRVENVAPYALFGDFLGDYNPGLSPGKHVLTATPYTLPGGIGTEGTSLTLSFSVVDQASAPAPTPGPNPTPTPTPTAGGDSVTSFSLINADTNQVIAGYESISDGAVLDLSTLPTRRLNIRANTDPATVGSVRFEFNAAPSHVENIAPYALCADYFHNYQPCSFSVGNYSIRATPFSGSDASGVAGNPLAISLQFVDQELDTGAPEITGELKKWHRVTITFTGPDTSEIAGNNPFMNYRLDLRFTSPSGRVLTVPGHYAADGNAAESGATSGKKWRAFLSPDETGTWTYVTSFRTGSDVAVSSDPTVGVPTFFDGAAGSFTISASDKSGPDNRARGALRYTGAHYLQFAETGQYFLKAGANSPENLLAYADFDNTTPTHRYLPHIGDYQPGDPSWKGGRGRGLIGALNYLAGKGMNSVHFLTMNVAGDGNDVWPWTSISERYRFDVSKLDQWEIVFAHMDRLGIMLHLNTQETENELLLDNGALGAQRRLYYRELISRFGHHLALTWDLGEENGEEGVPGSGNTDQQRKEFANFFAAIDAYNHPRVVHPFVGFSDSIFNPLLGFPNFEGPSLQLESMIDVHQETRKWLSRSASNGRKWVVTLDEIGPAETGVLPDSLDPNHDLVRRYALWGNLLAGGAGVEWYFGTSYPEHDLNCEDWRSRDRLWDITRNAVTFLQNEIPFWEFISADSLSSVAGSYVLARPNEAYVIYLPGGESTILDLGSSNETFEVRWYDPLNGGQLSTGSVAAISGPGRQSIGSASFTGDAVALVKRR